MTRGLSTAPVALALVVGQLTGWPRPMLAVDSREWAAKPNIVFILADDMGYGDPTCYNANSKTPTPNIDRLAAGGMRFTDAHAPGSVCVPSRYGLLTGRYPMRGDLRWRKQACIAEGRMTIASLLRQNGYRTAMVGKWHLGFDGGPDYDWSQPLRGGPIDRGFDTFFGMPASLDIPPYYYIKGRKPIAPPTLRIDASRTDGWTAIQGAFWRAGGIAPGYKHEQVLPRFGREAVEVIDRHVRGADPLFLYVALTAPHTPWLPLPKYRGKSQADMYGDFVVQVDDTVGQILAALDRNNLTDNTLIFFSSDNGPVWYDADEKRFGHHSTGPMRGMKGDAWEGGHRVPFVARWPNRIPAGTTSNQTLCFTDVMATLAAVVDVALPAGAGEDSYDMLPVLLGQKFDRPIREATIHKQSASAIRAGKWKLITHLGSGGFSKPSRVKPEPGGPRGQLYNMEDHPGETKNLWSREPRVVRRLTGLLKRYRELGRSVPAPGEGDK